MPKAWKPKNWLLFIYKVPSEPSRKRTFVWRHLNRMHALYLQQAVCLLPDAEVNARELEKLARRIEEFGGEVTLLSAKSKDATWEKEIEARFESEKNSKYEKLHEEITKFVDEIEFEEHRKRFTAEELEELEEKLEGLERWFKKLKERNHPSPRITAQTVNALKSAEERLDIFAAKVEQFEGKLLLNKPRKR